MFSVFALHSSNSFSVPVYVGTEVFVNIPNFIEEKALEIKIGWYRGTGGYFFFRVLNLFVGTKRGLATVFY